MCLIRAYPKGHSDAFIMHSYVKNYMYVYVNYIIKIQLKPERNRCTPGDPNTILRHQPISHIACNQCCAVKRWDQFSAKKIDPNLKVNNNIISSHHLRTDTSEEAEIFY